MQNRRRRAVFFDKDGVVNELVDRGGIVACGKVFNLTAPWTPEELRIYEDVPECVAKVRALGFAAVVITNQPDVSYGMMTEVDLPDILGLVLDLGFDDIFFCPHGRYDICDCRKPKPGMLLQAAKKWNIDLSGSFMIGDTEKDVGAVFSAGCIPIIIDRKYNQGVVVDKRITSLSELPSLLV